MIRLVILRILESYFRHRWLYLLPIVLTSALAVFYFLHEKPTYYAQGVLYVQNESYLASLTNVRDNSASWWVTAAQTASQDLNELLQTDAFVRAFIQQTDLEADMGEGQTAVKKLIDETRKSIRVYPLGENQIVVSATREEPEIAYQLVNAVVEGYLQWQINAQLSESETAQAFFNDVIKTYEAELSSARDEMKQYLETHPAPLRGDRPGGEVIEIDRLQGAIDLASTRYATALEKEESTRLAMAQIKSDARQKYFLIDAPRLPDKPNTSVKDIAIKSAIFLAAGFILSGAAIVGAAIIDRSLRLPIDVTHRLDLPVLSLVPDASVRRKWYQFRKKRQTEEFERLETLKEEPAIAPSVQAGELVMTEESSLDEKKADMIV
ncbi:MAG: lipopolysaccharide biosynthesis protein [Ardenticatenaceae bacterium]|nr:hypothetical protein [Anaerolineales bacterium]MCB8982734.1 lipopolysaccharide biosynthesis protein [Ardenticatenaceae bacterium]